MDILGSRVARGIWCALISFGAIVIVYELTNGAKRGTKLGHGILYALVGLVVVVIIVAVIYLLLTKKVPESRVVWWVLFAIACAIIGKFALRSIGGFSHLGDWWSAKGFFAWLVIIADLALCALLVHSAPDGPSK